MLDPAAMQKHEAALQRAVIAWILSGLFFMLLPGTFLGVWNLISITDSHTAAHLDPSWLQAHGHAQVFGWIGSFILGIGFYSLAKMSRARRFAVGRAWWSWGLWSCGVLLRWFTNVWQWQWRLMLPASALLELAAFLIFFLTVSGHHAEIPPRPGVAQDSIIWTRLVIAGSLGLLLSLAANLFVTAQASLHGIDPAIPHVENQRLLALFTWAFPVVTVWGFSARWLPVFLGLESPAPRLLSGALAVNVAAVAMALAGWFLAATGLFAIGAGAAAGALHVLRPSVRPPKVVGVHPSFPTFVRVAYVWLLASALLSIAAAAWDRSGGLWGSSRHALTVGFIATMVFAIGQRVLPAFCGMRVLFSPRLMFCSLALLNLGCTLRVVSEACAYEGLLPGLWPLLPVSAVVEMTAVTVFGVSLVLTFRQPPAHLAPRT